VLYVLLSEYVEHFGGQILPFGTNLTDCVPLRMDPRADAGPAIRLLMKASSRER
jgi:hypothetical protein